MKNTLQKNIVIRLRTGNRTGRNILAGILKGITDSDRFAIRIADDDDYFRRISGSASALIADSGAPADIVRKATAEGKPVVLLNDWRFRGHPANLGHIRTDDDGIGSGAADHLMSIGRFRSFGYIPAHTDKEWSKMRGRAFMSRLAKRGHVCRKFATSDAGNGDLGRWMKSLPKPAAVFCAYDNIAADAVYTARKEKIPVPDQLVILGVDNDEIYCTSSSPHISSIEFDAEKEGGAAAELVIRMLSAKRPRTGTTICCGTIKRIVDRESTRPPSPAAHLIERALEFIAGNAANGIGPKDVASHLGISRTLLDLRFRETGSATVGELISEKRLSILAAGLRESKAPIASVTKECGFGNINHAKAVFRKRFGMTMREWRVRGDI